VRSEGTYISLLRSFHKGDLMTLVLNGKILKFAIAGLSLNFVLDNKK